MYIFPFLVEGGTEGICTVADPGFQVRGGGALKKKLRRAEGGANIFGIFRVNFFFQF